MLHFLCRRVACETPEQWQAARDDIRARRYGVIETHGGRLVAVHLRPWPKLFAMPDLWPTTDRYHAQGTTDHCLLYYNQPLRYSSYLALKYVVSTVGTSYATFRAAISTLDVIAQLKRTDAILCDVANRRISDRFLQRLGWEAHKPQRWHRNFIKRFYGEYPDVRVPVQG